MQFIDSDNRSFSVPIPRIFYSFFHEGMFPKCSVCETPLLKDGVSYYIEKAYNKGEVVFEYAMCNDCRSSMEDEISEESQVSIFNYFFEHMDVMQSHGELIENFDNSVKPWLASCLLTGTKREETESYQICAECEGSNLVVAFLPLMISSDATEEMQKLISKKTRESFDGFVRDVLNPPVDFHDIPMLI